MNFTFQSFDYKAEIDKQRELFRDCFPETSGDSIQGIKHYMWKFHGSNGVSSWEFSCKYFDDIVGYYAALPYRYKIGNSYTIVGMVCDVMTSTRYRGKGIFTKLGNYSTQELANHVSFTMGYPIRKEVIPGHLKVGWEVAFKLPLYIKLLKCDSILKRYKLRFLSSIGNLILITFNFLVKQKILNSYSSIVSDKIALSGDFEKFTKIWQDSIENSLIKDSKFYNWRFGAPSRDYTFLTVKQNKNIVGVVVMRKILKYDVPSLCIVDYMVLPGHEKCHGYFNRCMQEIAKKQNAEAIMTMMSKVSAKKYKLLSNGFLKSPFTFKLIIKNLTHQFSNEQLFDENKWHLMWVDSDDL